ncbi:hypothetical protein ACQP00_33950 [Dactylosporangium sp. CS-047395]|uniref:hypothetical protein n=1 Tax=Dactylosporangium sp. CS-047395 TaxID=3239936 RepID=UPI003D90E484
MSAVLLLCTGVSVGTPVRTGALVAALALAVLPVVVVAVLMSLNVRNVAVSRSADGTVESVAWTGRRTIVHRPDSVRVHALQGRTRNGEPQVMSNLLVIAARDEPTPIVLVPQWWPKAELDRLTTAMRVPVQYADPETPGQFAARYPGARLPWTLRFGLWFPLVIVLVVTGALIGWIALLNAL